MSDPMVGGYACLRRDDPCEYLLGNKGSGWGAALYEMQKGRDNWGRDLFQAYRNSARAAWKFLLPIGASDRALVFGAGWDSVSIGLAHSCREVAVCDPSMGRLRSLRGRATYEGLENLVYVQAPIDGGLPFVDGSFDMVAVDGSLEWISRFAQAHPRQVHLEFFERVMRVLRPRGVLYLAIENKLSFVRFVRRKSRGRFLRDLLGLKTPDDPPPGWNGGKPDAGGSYTRSECKRLLREAGSKSIRFWSPVPHHRGLNQLVSLDRRGCMAPQVPERARWKLRWRHDVRFLRYFGQSFGMVASSAVDPAPGFLDCLLIELEAKIGGGSFVCRRFLVRDLKVVLFLANQSGIQAIAHIPYSAREAQGARNNAEALRRLEQFHLQGEFEEINFPRLLFEGEFGGHYVCVESLCEGRNSKMFLDAAGLWKQRAVEKLSRFLCQFGTMTRSDEKDRWSKFSQQLHEMVAEVSDHLIDARHRLRFQAMGTFILEESISLRFPTVWTHGDFHLINCLWNPRTHLLCGIVDWEFAQEVGLPGWDLFYLFAVENERASNTSMGSFLRQFLEGNLDESELRLWDHYAEPFGLERRSIPFLVLTLWIRLLWQSIRCNQRILSYEWVAANVEPMINFRFKNKYILI